MDTLANPFEQRTVSLHRFELRLGRSPELRQHAAWVREQVFVNEQGIDPEIEYDGRDEQALHAVVYALPARVPIATGRLLWPPSTAGAAGEPSSSPAAQIGRMAVLRPFRGQHLGTWLLVGLVQAAQKQGVGQVMVHAQAQAIPFYEANGFRVTGAPFIEAGIEHVMMTKPLAPGIDSSRTRL